MRTTATSFDIKQDANSLRPVTKVALVLLDGVSGSLGMIIVFGLITGLRSEYLWASLSLLGMGIISTALASKDPIAKELGLRAIFTGAILRAQPEPSIRRRLVRRLVVGCMVLLAGGILVGWTLWVLAVLILVIVSGLFLISQA